MKTFPQIAIMASACDEPDPQVASGPGTQPTAPRRSLRVLCIDDDEQVLESTKALLAYFGHRVGAAAGGKSGIEMFCDATQKGEPYDVVITDMNMPEVGGYVVAQTIKTESPGTPVVLMTGAGNTTRDPGSALAAVDAMIIKPPRLQELNDLLLRLARAGRPD